MPSFHFVKKSNVEETYLTNLLKSKFDININNEIQEEFIGEIPIENKKWNIGIIVGNSGTGKSSIANEIFKDNFINFKYSDKSIIDSMPIDNFEEISKIFNQVGFSSPPSWLKPYNVLSNGEKMRVDLAYCLISDQKNIIYDEFTSVVDREIAKIGSFCISKNIRKYDKKFIAVSCHFDIIEWLEPDWIFDTNSMTFTYYKECLRRPKINIKIKECNRKLWKNFKKYHYLNSEIVYSAKCYCLFCNNNLAGFIAIIHFPHPKVKNLKKVHRLVILPDYQGIGLGKILLEEIGNIYLDKKFRYNITTSQPSLINYFKNNKKWKLTAKGRNKNHTGLKFKGSAGRYITTWEKIR